QDLQNATLGAQQTMQGLTTQAQQFGSIAGTAISGVISALADGKITAEEFSQILAQIAQQLIQMALSGLTGGGSPGFGGNFFLGLLGSLFGGFARGGEVHGPGTSTSDNIPALLSDGEYVVR